VFEGYSGIGPAGIDGMKILLTGASGQLGTELYPRLLEIGDVTAVDLTRTHPFARNYQTLDLGDPAALEVMLNRLDPDLVVNAAAFTAVDKAEDEPELAFRINAKAPGRIARWARQNDCALLHYSTDYVFDGTSGSPYKENDQPSPLNIYGESKLAGELAIQASGCKHLMIRTSWVYSAHGSNFMLSMLRLARQQLQLSVVDDQVGCPTWARNLARSSCHLIRSGLEQDSVGPGNIYHYCDADTTTWFDFAQLVFGTAVKLGLLERVPDLKRVSTADFPQKATRPRYSVLDTRVVREAGFEPALLADSLYQCMKDLPANE
jgi:dTDP-4-dehydrorhamnose reductase